MPVSIGQAPLKTISSETLFDLKRKHDFGDSIIDSVAAACRKDLGRKGVEANSSLKIKEKSHVLDEFYTVEQVEFEEKTKVANKYVSRTISKDLVYTNNLSGLLYHICDQLELNPYEVIVSVGIDGRGCSLKLIMNIFNPNLENTSISKDTGVNKVIYIAAVKDIPETHGNLETIFQKTGLNELKYYVAADMKLLNILLGLSVHGGKFSCLYCSGTIGDYIDV